MANDTLIFIQQTNAPSSPGVAAATNLCALEYAAVIDDVVYTPITPIVADGGDSVVLLFRLMEFGGPSTLLAATVTLTATTAGPISFRQYGAIAAGAALNWVAEGDNGFLWDSTANGTAVEPGGTLCFSIRGS